MGKNSLLRIVCVGLFLICLASFSGAVLAGIHAEPVMAEDIPESAMADVLPESAYISGVIGHAQAWSLSCEARSAADWAAFWGVPISEEDFLSNLPVTDNPDTGFVGDPNDPWGSIPPNSYGVHARPVAELLRSYGLEAKAHKDLSWDDVRAEVAAGRPVIVWIIGQMWSGTPVAYTSADGKTTTVARFEHTMILIGYDASLVHVVDAYSGVTQTYALSTFLSSWRVLGKMAIFGQGSPSQVPTQPPAGNQATYTVQRGDYLTGLAEQFGTTWQELARLNDIVYPYTIYPGQVLKLPGQAAPTNPAPTQTPVKPSPEPAIKLYSLNLPLIIQLPATPKPRKHPVTATPTPAAEENYVVQRGEFLIELAERFGVDWRTLADMNDIPYPYVIYPGQVLTLK
ncbi:MAG: LysM peptidoglycan-binding domain-containing protein [Omnitrophica WOR_2 bacterium]